MTMVTMAMVRVLQALQSLVERVGAAAVAAARVTPTRGVRTPTSAPAVGGAAASPAVAAATAPTTFAACAKCTCGFQSWEIKLQRPGSVDTAGAACVKPEIWEKMVDPLLPVAPRRRNK